jgi:hypothetical protein
MDADLEAIKDAWDKTTGSGRDDEATRALCVSYVQAHPELTAEMHDWDIPRIVQAVSVLRAAGFTEKQWQVEAYQLAKFPPQSIGGEYRVEARLPEL